MGSSPRVDHVEIDVHRMDWDDQEYLQARAEGVLAHCYVQRGTEVYATIEEGCALVIRASADGQLLAETALPPSSTLA